MLYASDASLYEQTPLGIVRPKHRDDCVAVLRFAEFNKIPLIPRAGGTSLAGQVVGQGLIVDVSRYMTQVVDIDPGRRTARVQPGVVLRDLNIQLLSRGLQFAPDPSTANRCNIGGMIGNNAWGTHSPLYGTTRDHVLELELVLASGETIRVCGLDPHQLEKKLAIHGHEGVVYRTVFNEITNARDQIMQHFPDPNVVTSNMGYAVHVLANMRPWNENGDDFNLAALLCGSEGTLACITEATLNLVPVLRHKRLLCAHFSDLDEALQAVKPAVEHGASTVELLDKYILGLTKDNLEQQRNRSWLQGEPEAVLLIEFSDDDVSKLSDSANTLVKLFNARRLGYAFPILSAHELEKAWSVRRAALGLLMGTPGNDKPVTFIEDSAVPVAKLAGFVRNVRDLMNRYQTTCVYYGSVSKGLIHLRPILDLKTETDRNKLVELAQEVAQMLVDAGGTMSAKHGDGRVRSPFVEKFVGDQVYQALCRIKLAFDPHTILNPGKIVSHDVIDADLRTIAMPAISDDETFFDWSADNGFIGAVERCNGAGACRKQAGDGTMCPSYMATLEEKHSTRGRANVYRQLLKHYGFNKGITHQALNEVLDLCLGCKGCRSECPANVDMARLKSEHLQHYCDRFGVPLRSRFIQHFDVLTRVSSTTPSISNWVMQRLPLKRLLDFHTRRDLPALASVNLQRWFKNHQVHRNAGQRDEIVLVSDVFTNYYDSAVGIAAVAFLEQMGFRITLSPCFPSLRTVISQGLLRKARQRVASSVEWLFEHAQHGKWLIGLEPSELLTYRDELLGLANTDEVREKAKTVAARCLLFEEFVCKVMHDIESASQLQRKTSTTILVHGHCHQKSLAGTGSCIQALSLIPDSDIQTIPSGCCGMAGSFGYEKEHYDLSMAIGELVLFPAIRSASQDTIVVATGTSCRQQIKDGTGVIAYHPAQVLHHVWVEK